MSGQAENQNSDEMNSDRVLDFVEIELAFLGFVRQMRMKTQQYSY